MALPIMIDCDPGHDDAIALVLALASPELEVKAVTASAGNQTPEKTLRNVLRMLTLLNRPDIPVAGGAWKPLMRDLIIADNVHGESGLDGPSLPEPAFAPQNCTAVELMASVLRESQESVTLVATGPQTNVALLLASHPELHAKIARIVIMGGAMGLGNWQPAAEFNIYVDPQAAEMVFQSGIPVVMAGLGVSHRAPMLRRGQKSSPPISSDSARLATRCRPSSPNCSTSLWPTTKMKSGASTARRCTIPAPSPGSSSRRSLPRSNAGLA